MSPNVYRLIGPHHNRLVTVHPDAKKGMGQITHETAELLKEKAGWTRYTGTAEADEGWIIEGTDPKLKHRTQYSEL